MTHEKRNSKFQELIVDGFLRTWTSLLFKGMHTEVGAQITEIG